MSNELDNICHMEKRQIIRRQQNIVIGKLKKKQDVIDNECRIT